MDYPHDILAVLNSIDDLKIAISKADKSQLKDHMYDIAGRLGGALMEADRPKDGVEK